MIDIHAHVLPCVDDGSRSVAESVKMLTVSTRQGVEWMVATPHFYAMENGPEQFLHRREAARAALQAVWQPQFPKLVLGAEVYYFDGISRMEELDLLKIEHTNLLLLEMPFSTWTGRMVSEILELQDRQQTNVLLAHIERYLAFQKPAVWQTLLDGGVRMQCNAGFFLNWKTKRKALRMLQQGQIHFLGSDCHNMTDRPPRLGQAMKVIDESLSKTDKRVLDRHTAALLKVLRGR